MLRERERERETSDSPYIKTSTHRQTMFEVLGESSYVASQPSSPLPTRGDIVRSRVSWLVGHVLLWSCFYSRHALSSLFRTGRPPTGVDSYLSPTLPILLVIVLVSWI